jgi:hypothetical protein
MYSGVLLFFTQSVSIRRILLRRQPLTTIHDITAAWSGLGGAAFSLYKQISVASSIWGVFGVTTYLICLSILHIATPALFTIQLFNATSPLAVATTLAFPIATKNNL